MAAQSKPSVSLHGRQGDLGAKLEVGDHPRRFGLADPPYLGCGAKHYGSLHADAADCDDPEWHRALIERLVADFPDGWALCLHTVSLRTLLPMCPEDVRVGAWVKPFAAFKANVNPAYAWEPVIWRGGRKRTRQQDTTRDWIAESITLRRGLTGAKPRAFCMWIFDLLNVQPGDEVIDLFPGSGAVQAAIDERLRVEPEPFGLFHAVTPADGALERHEGISREAVKP